MKRQRTNLRPTTPETPLPELESDDTSDLDDAPDEAVAELDLDDQSWDAFLVDEDELDPDPAPGDFWLEDD